MIEVITNFFLNIFNKNEYAYHQNVTQCNEIVNGAYRAKKIVIDKSLYINGQAMFESDVRIKQDIVVNGSLNASKTIFESDLTANGNTSLNQVEINGKADFRGNISAEDTVFNGESKILSSKASFKNCKIQNIIIEQIYHKKLIQKIRLVNTHILGDITFNSGIGEVQLDSSSSIKGKIIGGKISKL